MRPGQPNPPFGNPYGFPMGFNPYGFFFPQPVPQETMQNGPPDLIVPKRVAVALEFLTQMSFKQMPRAVANEHQLEVLDPPSLSQEETATQDAALQLLTRYFDGKLEHDPWENLRYSYINKRTQNNLIDPEAEGSLLRCLVCSSLPSPSPSCPLCKGSGKIITFPVFRMKENSYEEAVGVNNQSYAPSQPPIPPEQDISYHQDYSPDDFPEDPPEDNSIS